MNKDVVLIGAGHAHLEVLRRFGMRPVPGARVTLIAREVHGTYSGMLPGVIAGLYRREEAQIDAGRLAAFAGARLVTGEATGLDLEARQVHCRGLPAVAYDLLSINIGSTPGASDIPGVAEHAIPVKPIDGFLARFEAARRRILDARAPARIGVVGGGAGGVELILALQRRLTREAAAAGRSPSDLSFTLITASEDILPGFPLRMRRRFAAILGERGIWVVTGARVAQVLADAVPVDGLGRIGLDEVFWTTQAAPAPWLAATGLALDAHGFVEVAETLQSVSHPDVLAAGDIASIRRHERPKSGVYAARAGPRLAANLGRLLAGRQPVAYRPQRDALALISTGGRYALGARDGLTVEGAWVWRLKDLIDRRFVARFARAYARGSPVRDDFGSAQRREKRKAGQHQQREKRRDVDVAELLDPHDADDLAHLSGSRLRIGCAQPAPYEAGQDAPAPQQLAWGALPAVGEDEDCGDENRDLRKRRHPAGNQKPDERPQGAEEAQESPSEPYDDVHLCAALLRLAANVARDWGTGRNGWNLCTGARADLAVGTKIEQYPNG